MSKQNNITKISLPTNLKQLKELENKNFIQSNYFIESSFLQPFKELELKVLALISRYINDKKFLKIEGNAIQYLQYNISQTLLIKISKQSFCNFLHTNPTNFYQQMNILSTELIKKSIMIESIEESELKNKKKFIYVTLFSCIACENGEAIFGINPILQIYLQHLRSNFTVLSLEYIANMNSSYAIKIYQLLKQYETLGKRSISLKELKKILGIQNIYLDNFKDFRKNVLEIPIKNINKISDIQINFTTKKNGKKVEEIEFQIIPKKNHLQKAAEEFKKQMDIYFSRIASMNLDLEHQNVANHWKSTNKDIEKNQELFELWIKNCTLSYNPQSIQELKIKKTQEFGTPSWYNLFLQTIVK